ncbi:MAG: O-antigen ligase family protein [Bacteroidota bacterium]
MVARLSQWLQSIFIANKLSGPIGVLFALCSALFIAFVSAKGEKLTFLLLIALLGVFFLFIVFVNPRYGFFTMMVIPFVFFELERFLGTKGLPINSLVQAISVYLMILILLKRKVGSIQVMKSDSYSLITWVLIVYELYVVIQAFNPHMHSLEGWFFAFRSSISALIIYLLVLVMIDSKKFVNQFFNLWFFLASASALYSCYQKWFGIPQHIIHYIHSDPLRYALIYVSGRYRIFSLLADPASAGIIISGSATIFLIFGIRNRNLRLKVMYLTGASLMILAIGYSGTRTAYATLLASLVLFAIMTINNFRTVLLIISGALGFLVLMYGPIYGNATVNRFRSTFDSEDASLNVRDVNRQFIQPYIYSHPLGGGVLTTEALGQKYNPDHELAGFPPDSGYLKMALETGWFGIFIYAMIFYSGITRGIRGYYTVRNDHLKTIYLAGTCFLFSISVANYAQKSTFGFPIITFIFPILAILSKLSLLDDKPEERSLESASD